MAEKKIKLTRTELKTQRDALARFKRYLPTLKLKQQQVQSSILRIRQQHAKVQEATESAKQRVATYQGLFNDVAGIDVQTLAQPAQVETGTQSIAGIGVPQFKKVHFPTADFSLFGTAPWIDRALVDLRQISQLSAELDVIETGLNLLLAELKKVMQRVNLFAKIMIPQTQDNIRRIRIAVGDQMTAGVARAKIAKAKLELKAHLARKALPV